MSNFKAQIHQIRFRVERHPKSGWGVYSARPDPLAGFEGPLLRGRGRVGTRGMERERKGVERGEDGMGFPLVKFKNATVTGM